MTDQELDIECAKLLGLEIIHEAWPCGYGFDGSGYQASLYPELDYGEVFGPVYKHIEPRDFWDEAMRAELGHWCRPVSFYSSEDAAAKLLEDDVVTGGPLIQNRYVSELWTILGCDGSTEGPNVFRDEWKLMRATPRQRADAYYAMRIDEKWDDLFAQSQDMLKDMAEEARREIEAGTTRPIEELFADNDFDAPMELVDSRYLQKLEAIVAAADLTDEQRAELSRLM